MSNDREFGVVKRWHVFVKARPCNCDGDRRGYSLATEAQAGVLEPGTGKQGRWKVEAVVCPESEREMAGPLIGCGEVAEKVKQRNISG